MQGRTHWLRAAACAAILAVTSTAMAQDTQVPRATGYADLARLPDWSGAWQADWSKLFGPEGEAPEPKLTPAAQAQVDAFKAKQKAEGVSQEAQIHCLPPGMPAIMRQPYPIEFLYSPGRVTIFAETYSQARRVYTDGRKLPEDPDLFFNGNSVGRWEGDTLIVDTEGFSPRTNIMPGLPHSGGTHIRERIWLESPDRMMIETTITNPELFTEPFVSTQPYVRHRDWDIREYVCEENNRLVGDGGGANIDLKLDETEDDPFADLPPAE